MNYWVCRTRLRLLTAFLDTFRQYAEVVETESPGWTDPRLYQLRNQLSKDLDAVQQALDDVGVGKLHLGLRAGEGKEIPVVVNAFNPSASLAPWQVISHIERGRGIYQRRQGWALLEMFNPFLWIGEFIALLTRKVVFGPIAAFVRKDIGDVAGTRAGRATLLVLQIFGNLASIAGLALFILFQLGVL